EDVCWEMLADEFSLSLRTLHRQLTDQQSERFNEMLDVLDDQELGQLLAITKKLEQTVPLGGEQGPCRKEDL
ncbi:MAG: hypothetical protein RR320_01170, partial [Oscillospiraceae bacterium]